MARWGRLSSRVPKRRVSSAKFTWSQLPREGAGELENGLRAILPANFNCRKPNSNWTGRSRSWASTGDGDVRSTGDRAVRRFEFADDAVQLPDSRH
jgi:hypothetical protein